MVTARETRRNGSRSSGLKKWRQKLGGILLPLAGILGFLIIWQIFSSSGQPACPAAQPIHRGENAGVTALSFLGSRRAG